MDNRRQKRFTKDTNSKEKTVSASRVIMNEMVMPNDTNPLGNLMGGRLMQWMDVCSAISARRHCNRNVVTVAADSIEFKNAIKLGEVVVIEGEVTRTFTTSMEIAMEVWSEDQRAGERRLCTTSFYTFVALDADGNTVKVPEIIPETDFEKERYEQAADRRQMRLKVSAQNIQAHRKEK
ncbi:acyl-CoA thioesterase [Fodinibius halophilus]|uniref:Acyl-CoA thioesterase n=1 Tax=Fodinibius halophilus TaxID=1736908 RepID=A0A6M1T9F0_9BACT|nr:acyl-CoA thioesterase [Fodinibius halophilus]NGP89143.1 acyl-CoA thioesterase [Fodinibius halophilus]